MIKLTIRLLLLMSICVFSCCNSGKILKYYYLNDNCQVAKLTEGKSNLEGFDLKDYIFYKREIYVKYDRHNRKMYKGYEGKETDSTRIRFEMQFIAIENKSTFPKKVMYFSTIPSYKFRGKYIYDYPLYDREALINIQSFNLILFGILRENNQILFKKRKKEARWNIDRSSNNIEIRSVIQDNGTFDAYNLLGNRPTFIRIQQPQIVLHYFVAKPLTNEYTDFVKNDTFHYDTVKHRLFIEFKAPLWEKKNCRGNYYTWIHFPRYRIKAKYSPINAGTK